MSSDTPILEIEKVFKHLDELALAEATYKLFVPPTLVFEGQAVSPAIGMRLILGRLMDLGFSYHSSRPMGAGRIYRYQRWFIMPRRAPSAGSRS
jgi:hypothetical protein